MPANLDRHAVIDRHLNDQGQEPSLRNGMDIDDVLKVAALLGSCAATIGLPLVLIQLRHRRAANFTATWKAIESGLQDKDVRIGRAICRRLSRESTANTPLKEFPDDASSSKFLMELEPDRLREEVAKFGGGGCLERYVSKAYDAFDLAAILAWHSRVPGLCTPSWPSGRMESLAPGRWVHRY